MTSTGWRARGPACLGLCAADGRHAVAGRRGRAAVGGDRHRGHRRGHDSRANAVSDTGQVVGSYTTAGGQTHAFSWTRNGGFVDLGTLGGTTSEALGVNNAGQVVGSCLTAGDATHHAFLWSPATGMLDIGTLGGTVSHAYDINNAGQIVGSAHTYGEHCLARFSVVGRHRAIRPGNARRHLQPRQRDRRRWPGRG